MATEARKQLEVFHDPFSAATSQPKIPDGKTTESLGISVQTVGEIVNEVDGDADTMHLLLFAGQNTGLIAFDSNSGIAGTQIYGFEDAGGCDWTDVGGSGGNVSQNQEYGQWRVVSTGLRLSLLNAVEEDDGWFEAVRLNEPLQTLDYFLATVDRTIHGANNGCIVPGFPATRAGFKTRTLSNEPSYVTGLLRDFENYQFDLHGKLDHHDFIQGKQNLYLETTAISASTPFVSPFTGDFTADGYSSVYDVINQYIDPGYDMIYIRVHSRANTSANTALNGSRLHYNLVSNQEITYQGDQRDSRYQTVSSNIGLAAAARHGTLRRLQGQAGTKMN